MKNNNVVKIKLANLAIVLSIIFSIFSTSPALAKKNRYVALERVVSNNPELDLFINQKSQTIDLARTQNIRVRIKARDLYNSIDRTASFKIAVFENDGTTRKFISSQQLSVFKGFKRSRVLSISAGDFTSPTKNLEFDVYDTAGNVINSYKTTISAINLESQVSGNTGINIAEANCDGTTFGECQIDYLLQRVQFEAKPQRQASTRVVKTNDGLYKVTFPFPRNKFKFLGRKVRRKTKDNFGNGSGGGGTGGGISDFGETLNISTINIGNSLSESQFITYGPNGDLIFNDNLFLDLEGKLGVGVQPPEAWLHVRNGDAIYPSFKIGQGPLTTLPVDGAIEYDGTNLYFTVGTTRNILGSGFGGSNGGTTTNNNSTIINNNVTQIYNQGNILFNQTVLDFYETVSNYYDSTNNYFNQTDLYRDSHITYDNGTIIEFMNGSYIQNGRFNGFNLFTNNSYTQINGALAIPGGTQYQVLTYINGLALWRDSSAVFNGVTSINQTFNITNGTYNIDNGTYNYNDTIVNVDNGTYNYYDTIVNVNNGVINYNDTIVNVDNGTYYFTETTVNIDNGTYNYTDTTVNVDNGTYNYYNTIQNFYNGDNYFYNYDITYVDNFHQYFNTTILFNETVLVFQNGSYMQNPVLNGKVLHTNNSHTQINGTLSIPGGSQHQVLTYINGFAMWRDPTASINGGTFNYFNGTENYFNQTISFVDNIHNYFNTVINTTNNIENHNNLHVTYTDVFEQYFNGVSNYYNQSVLYENSEITLNNTDLLFTNGSRLIIPGGTNGQVLTYVNGEALWRDSTSSSNGGTTNFNNGTTNYFNQTISFVDNIHNYTNTTINTTNNIENHNNLHVTYTDVFEQYFNGVSNYYNQTVLYENSEITLNNTDLLFTNGSRLIIPGGVNGQVLTYVNGEALWRDSLSTVINGTTSFENGKVFFNNTDTIFENGTVFFNQTELTFKETTIREIDTTRIVDNGRITYTNGTVITFRNGSYMEDPVFNGDAFFTNNSFVRINGTLQIPGGNLAEVLTSDANGIATWQTAQWTDIGAALHPTDLSGTAESVIIGGNSIATADIELNVDGSAIFNKQDANSNFSVHSAAGITFFVNGTDSTVSVGTAAGTATLNVNGSLAVMGTSTQLITAGTGITADATYTRIAGNGGAVTITANPQITTTGTVQDGQILILKGTDDTNNVTLVHGNGVSLESGVDFTIRDKDIIQLIYDSVDSEWIEIGRSDK